MTLLLLLACAGKGDEPAGVDGVLDQGPYNPFPSAELVADGHLALPEGLPYKEGGTPLDVARLGYRTGFSPVQTAVVRLDVTVDRASLVPPSAAGTGGSVQLWDLDAGAELPCFAELDAWPDAPAPPTLLVRPARAMPVGHRVAVVLTDRVRTADGAPLPDAAWARAVAEDAHYAELAEALAALGVTGVALAWDFPIGSGTAPLDAMLEARAPVTSWTFDDVRVDDEDGLPPGMWKRAEGRFVTTDFLVDDRSLALDADGVPAVQGTTEADLYVLMPESAAATADPMPVVIFGHGILADPGYYFYDGEDTSRVVEVANRLGAILIGTTWRGLTTDDLADTVGVSTDFGRFPEVADRLTQAVVNTRALVDAVAEGGLLDDPLFEGRADPSRVYWYGISLGAIQGATLLANQDVIDHAVLHVGGSSWSTMLERSSNWPYFETSIVSTIPEPHDRQLLYAATQLYWDQVDPASYADRLAGRSFLWQESIGDDQVPNFATELLMRSVGVPLGAPAVTAPLDVATVDLPAAAPAFVQFDPEKPLPPEDNRPAPDTDAHDLPRRWEGTVAQTVGFFAEGGEGWVAHHCGDAPCSASNPGE